MKPFMPKLIYVEPGAREYPIGKEYVAKEAKIAPSSLSKIISGETKEPRLSLALRLAKVLGTQLYMKSKLATDMDILRLMLWK